MTSPSLEWQFAIDVGNELGEGIQWHAPSQSLWWTDIQGCTLFCHDWSSQSLRQWTTPERLTAFGLLSADPVRLIVSFASGMAVYEPDSGLVEWLARPEQDVPGNRFNDGRVDRQGRFWSGTMVEDDQGQTGSLYRLDAHGAQPQLSGLTIPNALCWSPDSRHVYHADTPTGLIRRYPFDAEHGTLGEGIVFARAPKGNPDGACVDAEGHVLCALWGGSAIARFAPSGELVAVHDLPVSQPTCVALGGPDMDMLFISSAHAGMASAQRSEEPMAGSVLVYKSPYTGLPESTPRPL